MKTISINSNAWHWQLFKRLGWECRWTDDFCSYCRWLGWALVLIAFRVLAGSFVVYAIWDFVYWIVVAALYGVLVDINVAGGLVATVLIIACAIGLLLGAMVMIGFTATSVPNLISEEKKEFMASAWESFHDKVCFRIRLNDTEEF